SVLWLAVAVGLGVAGGSAGRRAAVRGTVAIGVTSPLVNLAAKSAWSRRRPDRANAGVPVGRNVRMPTSASFPSGHAASGFAFATAIGRDQPWLVMGLGFLAAAVAYSRVHTGVHYPGDAVVGALLGAGLGQAVAGSIDRLFPAPAGQPGHDVDRADERRARRTRWRQRLASTATRLLASRSQTISSAVWPAAPLAIKAPSVARAAASTGSIGGADPSSPAGSDPSPGSLPSEERSPTMFTPSASMRAAISALISAARARAQAGVAILGSSGDGWRAVFMCSTAP